jgi:hypothetical protein
MFRMRPSLSSFYCLIAILALMGRNQAMATPDSLFGDFGDVVKMYHLYSSADGSSHIEEINVPPSKPNSNGTLGLFSAKAQGVSITAFKDGYDVPFHVLDRKNIVILLQGTLKLNIGDGKEYPLYPGVPIIGEDWTGRGHAAHCEAKVKKRVCLLYSVDLGEMDRSSPLR